MHGRLCSTHLDAPSCIWESNRPPRDDHEGTPWLTASEFEDTAAARATKVATLAALLRSSRRTVLYTGAGISASAIGQAARSGTNTVGWKLRPREAEPTFTHAALALLCRRGIVHHWVQQNHDGLPQKAGCPQEMINEVHGSWSDPGNPVVKYGGTLHERAFPWMEREAAAADLTLVLGTSLGGLTADMVATNVAKRSCKGGALGAVCINLQQTPQDGKMTLRHFGRSDDVLRALLSELGLLDALHSVEPTALVIASASAVKSTIAAPSVQGLKLPVLEAYVVEERVTAAAALPSCWPTTSRVLVPYDKFGMRLPEDAHPARHWMWWDLTPGREVSLTAGHNIQGAKQPAYMHIGRPDIAPGTVAMYGPQKGAVAGPGNGVTVARCEATLCIELCIEGASMSLGLWWLDAAVRGAVPQLPIVNRNPEFSPTS